MGAFADMIEEIDSRPDGERLTIKVNTTSVDLEEFKYMAEYDTTLIGATYSYNGKRYGEITMRSAVEKAKESWRELFGEMGYPLPEHLK